MSESSFGETSTLSLIVSFSCIVAGTTLQWDLRLVSLPFGHFLNDANQEAARMRTRSAGRAFRALQGKLELCGPERVAGVQVSAVEAAREPAGALL